MTEEVAHHRPARPITTTTMEERVREMTGEDLASPLDGETWRAVVGFEGIYEISDQGRLRRVGRAARIGNGRGGGAVVGRILKPQPRQKYLAVQLWRDGKVVNRLVHVAVAEAFIGPRPEAEEVNHKNGDTHDNRAENLEWLTRRENLKHAYRTTLRSPSGPYKVTIEIAVTMRAMHESGASARQIARTLQLGSHHTVLRHVG